LDVGLICEQPDRQTDTHRDTLIAILRTPIGANYLNSITRNCVRFRVHCQSVHNTAHVNPFFSINDL